MKIRDTTERDTPKLLGPFEYGIDVIGPKGEELFNVRLSDDGALEVRTGSPVKFKGKWLDTQLAVLPQVSNSVLVIRQPRDS